jgi:mannose/cellobiose epimerase-like protein (N-acyl-D-glucosamine 2-epimerase family)
VWAVGEKQNGGDYPVHTSSETRITKLAGMTLTELRDFHVNEIEKVYLPMWNDKRIDRQYGGVRPYLRADGSYQRDNKEMYYLGRAIWTFSWLYNNFGKRKDHLDIAEKTIGFVYKYGRAGKGVWNSEFTREGKVTLGSFNIYGDMYVVLGLGEHYKATGNRESLDTAIETAHSITERINSPSYMHLAGHGAGNEPGTKRLGTWQHFLSVLTPLARYSKGDYGVEMIARMCVTNILQRHWHPELGVCFEQLNDQFQPYPPDSTRNNRNIHGWHSIQASWMCMDESLRTGSKTNFMTALEMGRQTMETCWVEKNENGDSGVYINPSPETKPVIPKGGSIWGAMDDAMVWALLAIEHTHAPWAVDWFNKIFLTSYEHPERFVRNCLLHHPRRLFLVKQMLDRMIARDGRVSGFLEVG